MRPVIIGVGGAYSGVGKTTVVCEILRRFENWGAIKYTKTPFYSSVTDDMAVLAEEGKDTKRFLDAGAVKVVWVQSPYSELPVTLPLAAGMFSQVRGILVEGNSAIEVITPDILIFISGSLQEKWKANAENILAKADIVLYDKEPSRKFPSARTFSLEQTTEYLQYLETLIRRIGTEG
jgi:molybdopterin-guanine dinucleotide biosynthesis protein